MKVRNYLELDPIEDAPGVLHRVAVGADDGAPRFAMRVFEVEPGSSTPFHIHWWEHEVFVLAGEGVVKSQAGETRIGQGTVVYVAPDEQHCFSNNGSEALRFICVIPLENRQDE